MKKGYLDERHFIDERSRMWKIPVQDRQGKNLTIKGKGSYKPKGKTKRETFETSRLVWGVESGNPQKVVLIEERKDEKQTIRFGYRTLTHKTGKWNWGQFALTSPLSDVRELLQYAKSQGIDLF